MIVYIAFNGTGANSHETDADLTNLLSELRLLGEIRVEELAGQKGPAGTEMIAAEVITAGAVTKIAEVIGGWLLKDRSRSLKLRIGDNEIAVSGLAEREQQKLIKWFQDQTNLQRGRRK